MEKAGIYGQGYKDDEGNLYLEIEGLSGILVREKAIKEGYDIGVIDDSAEFSHISLLENISLREWRELFCYLKKNWARTINEVNDFVHSIMPAKIYFEC